MGLEVLYLLIPVTLTLALVALGLFFWALHSGQFDDLETPAIRILFDDESDQIAGTSDVPDPHGEPPLVKRPV